MKKLLLIFIYTLMNTTIYSYDKPNIIFFIADDISQNDFGCYGHPTIKTPNIDSLAGSGMVFQNAYLTTSSCSPSRCSIITGRYPHNTGAPELHSKLPDDQIRFTELLKEAGYYTVLSGKNHMFKDDDQAFDIISAGVGPGKEEDWVPLLNKRPKNKPFFFWFAALDAHRGWKESKQIPIYRNKDVIVPPFLIDSVDTRTDLASYYHEVSRFDFYIGEVIKELKKQKVFNKTLIVIAADNGRPFPRCKSRLYDSGIKTPWIVHYPTIIKKGTKTKSLISSIDFSATCLELARLNKPKSIQGISFLPILNNPNYKTRDMVFAEHNWHVYKSHERMVRYGDFVYIKNNYPDIPNICVEAYANPSGRDLWITQANKKTNKNQKQLFESPLPSEELFDLAKDPYQLINLASNPEYSHILNESRKYLRVWTEQTGDSIPTNPTPNRFHPPRIEGNKILERSGKIGAKNPHAEFPGKSKGATGINHPGPVLIH